MVQANAIAVQPRWPRLALEREQATELEASSSTISTKLLPASLAVAVGMVAAANATTWAQGIGLAGVFLALFLVAHRIPLTKRLLERRRQAQLRAQADRLKDRLALQLTPTKRSELERLETIVELIRRQNAWRNEHVGARALRRRLAHRRACDPTDACAGELDGVLTAHLDALLLLFVDLGIEFQRVLAGFNATADDLPRLAPVHRDAGPDTYEERGRCRRLARLRARARLRCRARLQCIQSELESLGQLIRLVHEQSLGYPANHADLSRMVGEVLEEARLARQAREEADGVCTDRRFALTRQQRGD
jgi:hypothetical protein